MYQNQVHQHGAQRDLSKELVEIAAEIGLNLGHALSQFRNQLLIHPELNMLEQLDAIIGDKDRLTDYWLKGVEDAERKQIYNQLKSRTYQLVQLALQTIQGICERHISVETDADDMSCEGMRAKLESYVTDLAMLELEPENKRADKSSDLNRLHGTYMNAAYEYIVSSSQWTEAESNDMLQLLLLPTVDSTDLQLIVSAITVNLLSWFDIYKYIMLAKLYQQSEDEYVRQRALVGWAFASSTDSYILNIYPDLRQWIDDFVKSDGRVQKELQELQIQTIYCMQAMDDHRKIQEEIMPDLMKGNAMRLTPNGIEEKEEDPLEDILHPKDDEEQAEKVELQFKRLQEMQSKGSDIYFGGFSMMKQFPFFEDESNWLVPFYENHPAIHAILERPRSGKFIKNIIATGPFCNSDKYSFVIGFEKVFDKLPHDVVEVMEQGGNVMMANHINAEELRSPAYIRRIYLQDLYRFFRLYRNYKDIYRNPYDEQYFLFIKSDLLKNVMYPCFSKVASLFFSEKKYHDAYSLLYKFPEEHAAHNLEYLLLCGSVMLKGSYSHLHAMSVVDVYETALRLQPDDVKIMARLGRAYDMMEDTDSAIDTYRKLIERNPDNPRFQFRLASLLADKEEYEEAQQILYRLNYEYSDNPHVAKILGWCLLMSGKYEQAQPLLTMASNSADADCYSYYYMAIYDWTQHLVKEAADNFVKGYQIDSNNEGWRNIDLHVVLFYDKKLDKLGISQVDRQLMIDYLLSHHES